MKFKDVFVSKKERFSIGVEEQSGKFYLSIPVSNGVVDYEEYYEIGDVSFNLYQNDMAAALKFVELCRNRQADNLLIIKPGRNRGVAI